MAEETIFDKLIRREIPSNVVYEDDCVFAFRDIAPAAPTHILIIPKHKQGLTGLSRAEEHHEAILGKLLVAAAKIAKQEGLEQGYRIVINDGEHAGQTVFHLHVHLLGGKHFSWPPGTSL
jgi:diadenosine tetraphosphate (Ap4A) HIT family hydrolase